jgi:hypothetical protein
MPLRWTRTETGACADLEEWTVTCQVVDGAVTRLVVEQRADGQPRPGGLAARQLRSIDLGGAAVAASQGASLPAGAVWTGPFTYMLKTPRLVRLARVALFYHLAVAEGDRRPNERVAAQFGLTASQVRDLVHEARYEGLLTASPGRGKAGGSIVLARYHEAMEATE